MKTIQFSFYLFILGSFTSLFAQEESGNGLLLPRFEKGIVVYKNGVRSSASLNYDMIRQQMVLLDADSTVMGLGNLSEVSAVIIGERRFLPASPQGVSYEVIPAGKASFFVKRKATLLSKGKPLPFGGYSQTSSAISYGSWQTELGGTVKLNRNEELQLDIKYTYYLKSGNSYKSFYSAKTLGKLFKGYTSDIEKFANEQSINFSKMEDIARIVEYACSLVSNE